MPTKKAPKRGPASSASTGSPPGVPQTLRPRNLKHLPKQPTLREVIDPPPTKWAGSSAPPGPRIVLCVIDNVPVELVHRGAEIYELHVHGEPLRLEGAVRVTFVDSHVRIHQIDGTVGELELLIELTEADNFTPPRFSGTRARLEIDNTVTATIHNTWGYTHATGFVEVDLRARTARIELADYVSV